jgi:phosphoglycerate dehydrogenase-like enzyme
LGQTGPETSGNPSKRQAALRIILSNVHRILITEEVERSGFASWNLNIQLDATLAHRPDELIRRASDQDALVVRNVTRVDSALIDRLRESTPVRVIGRLGAGLDNIDVPRARQAGLEVVYTPDANTESTAQYVLGQILLVTRHLSEAHKSTAHGEWVRLSFTGRELSELTVGIVGFGRIGTRLAGILSSFGCQVLVSTRRPESVPPPYLAVPLTDLFSAADVISIHMPLTEATRGAIGLDLLQLMRPRALIINTSRGAILREQDLDCFLRSRPDAAAVLDVRSDEPPVDRRFCGLPNAYLSPHIAAFTSAAQKKVLLTVLADIERVLSGGAPVWPAP